MATTTVIARQGACAVPRLPRRRPAVDWSGYLFIAFFAIPFLIFNICPILFGAIVGFTEWGIIGAPEWIGLDNFRSAFANE